MLHGQVALWTTWADGMQKNMKCLEKQLKAEHENRWNLEAEHTRLMEENKLLRRDLSLAATRKCRRKLFPTL